MRLIAKINEWTCGTYGRSGKYGGIVEPELLKNGKMKKTGFKEIERLETLKDGYRCSGASHSESIAEIIYTFVTK